MTTRRKLLIALGAGALAGSHVSIAQLQPPRIARIGLLGSTLASGTESRIDALRTGLREYGYVEGKNLVMEFRWADENYSRLPELAAELVALKIDVLVANGSSATRAAKGATTTIPIVMSSAGDAIGTGLVHSLARPGGNITGTTYMTPELSAKRLEIIKEIFPDARQIAILVLNSPTSTMTKLVTQAAEDAAKALKLETLRYEVRGPGEFEKAFSAMVSKRVQAVAILESAVLNINIKKIADIAAKNQLPSFGIRELADAGGLIGFGVNILENTRRAAYFVDRVLKGTKPADLPVEQPTRFELVVNLKAAKSLGIKIPPAVLVRATTVIE